MPGGYRWMYHLTGLPGWMRFGFSPGWLGISPTGLGPMASLMMTHQWPTPQAQAYWQAMRRGQAPYPLYGGAWAVPFYGSGAPGAPTAPQMSPEQEVEILKSQAQMMRQQLDEIMRRIEELEKRGK